MAHHNQEQYGSGRISDNRGGEYNNNKENVREDNVCNQQQQQQQQEFVSPSLCIPRTHANIRKERIFAVIRSLGLGWIGRIDVVEKKDDQTGVPFIRVFIHFTKWFQNAQTRQFLEHLETQKSANIVYDEPWFWKVTKSFVPAPMPHHQQQQQQPSRFPRPRIDFEGGASSTRVQQEEVGGGGRVSTVVVSSKTPSSNASGTNAVSGKGKQVAKRMGYESGKGLGKKADGRIVPVQIKKNIGRNGIGLGSSAAAPPEDAVVDAANPNPTSSDYWTTHAHEGYTQAQIMTLDKNGFPKTLELAPAAPAPAAAVEQRLSVPVSPQKLERRLFHDCCDDDDGVASAYRMNKSNSA